MLANETDVPSKWHAKGLVLRLTEEASKLIDVTSKRHAKELVLRLTVEASKRNIRDLGKVRKGASPQIDCGSKQTKQT